MAFRTTLPNIAAEKEISQKPFFLWEVQALSAVDRLPTNSESTSHRGDATPLFVSNR